MNRIVECVPNFSEGRRQEVIDRIVGAMRQVDCSLVMDVQWDSAHNRSVVTLLGDPQTVSEAVFHGIATAAELIDLNHHRGGHPRMGATDVVPFVPVRGVTIEDCVVMARQLGERVGTDLGIPVYLYEAAATRPERQNLVDVRRGEYEGLKEEIRTNPDRAPDFGPSVMGTAGATAIGARLPMIAFNVFLNTDDLAPARAIAKAVRHSSGGLRFVKALPLLADGQAEISMNLTNFGQTPVHRVLEMIRSEAAHYGLTVTHTEFIGLVPLQAITDVARFYLQMDGFSTEQVLENRLFGSC
jgi:glutamate formiminotransferase/formiminotetrahydrofolate cyclodeaminase